MVTVELIRSTVVTVPVSGACWAIATELTAASMEPAKIVFTSRIENLPDFGTVEVKPQGGQLVPRQPGEFQR